MEKTITVYYELKFDINENSDRFLQLLDDYRKNINPSGTIEDVLTDIAYGIYETENSPSILNLEGIGTISFGPAINLAPKTKTNE